MTVFFPAVVLYALTMITGAAEVVSFNNQIYYI